MKSSPKPAGLLPANIDVERLVLGAVIRDSTRYPKAAEALTADDFSLEKHRRIWEAMGVLHKRGDRIDRITLAACLQGRGQLESVDGLAYLADLDQGLPDIPQADTYMHLLRRVAVRRRIAYAGQFAMDQALDPREEPETVIAQTVERLTSAEQMLPTTGDMATVAEIIEEQGGVNVVLDPAQRVKGLTTGFVKFDEMTGGLRKGDLIIIGARPAMGKTAWALNIAQYVVLGKHPQGVALFSLEMSKESLLTRLLCAVARMDGHKFRAGYVNADERRRLQFAAHQLSEAPLFIDDRATVSLAHLRTSLSRLRAKREIALVIVDYLQLMTPLGKFENRNQEVAALSRGLKMLAKDHDLPVMALSQLSRACETRQGSHRPQLSDLRETGSLEAEADLVCLIFRPEMYKTEREDLRGLAELIVAKQRNGPTGTVNLVFLKQFTKFENRTSDVEGNG